LYEQAVARAAEHARGTGATVVSDTSWDGYETIPRLIMAGYTRILAEAGRQWPHAPDVVIVQGGVGGLVCAAANWFSFHFSSRRPYLIVCEPESSACLLASARERRLVHLEQPRGANTPTMMAGLRCAAPSPAAWPSIAAGIDAFVAVPDAIVADAIERLQQPPAGDPPIAAGPSGACGVGALLALLSAPELASVRDECALDRSTGVMAIVTEGP
jgi:diaminopropionate ammonia-lyase